MKASPQLGGEREKGGMILSALPYCLTVRSNEEIIYPSFLSGALRVIVRQPVEEQHNESADCCRGDVAVLIRCWYQRIIFALLFIKHTDSEDASVSFLK